MEATFFLHVIFSEQPALVSLRRGEEERGERRAEAEQPQWETGFKL